jgi:two-component system, sensor histidine kinase and response regulator
MSVVMNYRSLLSPNETLSSERARQLTHEQNEHQFRRTDRMFAGLLAFEFVAGIATALWISPYAWAGHEWQVHPHVWSATLLGALIVSLPIWLAWVHPGKTLTRHVIAIAQLLMSGLLIHLTQGRIETHFHVFGSLAFLAFYRDWRVLITASAVTAVDHLVRGYVWPLSIYGVELRSQWRWLEHTGWVLFEDIFLIFACQQSNRETNAIAERQSQLEQAHDELDKRVRERTLELERANQSLLAEVSEREQVVSALRLNEFSVANASLPTFWIARDARIRRVNRAACELLGYSEAELLALAITDLDPNYTVGRWSAHWQELSEKKRMCFETQQRHKQGHIIPVEVDLNWFEFEGQGYNFAFVRDITERKRAEEELRRAKEAAEEASRILDSSLKSIADGVIIADSTGKFLFWNEVAEQIIGLGTTDTPVEGWTAHYGCFLPDMVTPYPSQDLPLARTIRGEEVHEDELFIRNSQKPDGVWLSVNGRPLRDETNQLRGGVVVFRDTTERRRHEVELHRAKEAAESASLAKSSFLANMSHEIRTPMNGIIGMAQLLAQTELRSHQRDYLATIDESAHILLRLLNDILDFSKIEAGKLELESVDFRVSECVARASQMLQLRAAEKGLELACRVAPEIPDHLRGDSGRLQQVLVNLLGNAVKFTADGEIFVNVNAESITSDLVRLHFSVSDTGIGIPEEIQDQIFRPFEQAESSTTRRFGGTGLGLTISRQLVEMMHGRMWVVSEVGRGSTFHFTAEFGIATDQQLHESGELDSLRDLPVLVVDDNFTNRRILSEMLQYWHMQPVLADSAEHARQALQQADASRHPIRLILLDHHMPGEDGLHFAESLSGTQNRGQCPLIMISSGMSPIDADLGQKYGIGRFMTKPVIASELLNEILRQFGRYTTLQPTQPPTVATTSVVHPRRVLLVEDNEINRRVAMGLLRSRGHQVVVAENGQEAVNTLAEQEFDVVLMDMQMPVMDGYQATAAIRKSEHHTGNHIPIVAMTAEALKGDRERCLATGMDDYVSKPIAPAELFRAVESFPAICLAAPLVPPSSGSSPTHLERQSEKWSVEAVEAPLPAIDWNEATRRLGGGADVLCEFTDLLKLQLPTLLSDIRRAIEVRDSKLLRRSAHTLKSSVAYFGAEPLVVAALALENLGRAESFDSSTELLATLERELVRVVAALDVGPPG